MNRITRGRRLTPEEVARREKIIEQVEVDFPDIIQQALKAVEDPASRERYRGLIERMIAQGRAWISAHPEASPKVQFNYPPGVMLIVTLEGAIKRGAVSMDDQGRELVDAMKSNLETEPTCFMLRCAMDLINN